MYTISIVYLYYIYTRYTMYTIYIISIEHLSGVTVGAARGRAPPANGVAAMSALSKLAEEGDARAFNAVAAQLEDKRENVRVPCECPPSVFREHS